METLAKMLACLTTTLERYENADTMWLLASY